MDPLHARYPFLAAARESVREADLGLAAIVTDDGDERRPAVERGVERVRRALLDGTVEPPADDARRWSTRAELLSYPVARVLISLLDAPGAVEKYASAEADAAYERFTADLENPDDGLKSTADKAISLDALLAEFGLASAVGETPDGYRVAVGAYLPLASGLDGEEWRLATRQLADGYVAVDEGELHLLLREAVRERVAEGLPTRVPDEIREGLTDEVAELEDTFSEVEFSRDIGVLAPGQFPPCMTSLLDRARAGADLPAHSTFSLVSFLASAGVEADELLALVDADDPVEATGLRYRLARVGDESGAQYAPPSCATMQAYGDCPVADDADPTTDARCETIAHPLSYYEEALAAADEVDDWRER